MKSVDDIHNEAMDYAHYGLRFRRKGDDARAGEMFAKSLVLELEAIAAIQATDEPDFSIMHRSAATLAIDCGDYRLAEQLASKALAGNPPEEQVWELRDVLERTKFLMHMQLDNLVVREAALTVRVAGGLVGDGSAFLSDFMPRVNGVAKLVGRVWDYVEGVGHDESPENGGTRSTPPIVLSALQTGSLAVTLRIGSPDQTALQGTLVPDDLFGQTIDVVRDVAELDDPNKLASKYPDEAYRRNFVNLVRDIAPDGGRVSLVGLSAVGEEPNRFNLTTTKRNLKVQPKPAPDEQHETIVGRLRFADAVNEKRKSIKIITENGEARTIRVPAGMMNDVVRPLWNQPVSALCVVKGKTATLVEVDETAN